MGGLAEADLEPRRALGIVSARNAAPEGRVFELQFPRQDSGNRRCRQCTVEPRDRDSLQLFRPAPGHCLSHEREDSDPHRLRRQLHAVPRQQLRLQLPGARQQRVQSGSRQLRSGIVARWQRVDFREGVPCTDQCADSDVRHHSGDGRVDRAELLHGFKVLQESICGKLELCDSTRAARSLHHRRGVRG